MAALLPLLARYAWPWAAFAALLAAIGVQQLRLGHSARTVATQRVQLEAAGAMLQARQLEHDALTAAIAQQNRNVEALRAAQVQASDEAEAVVRTVVVRDRRTFSPKNAKDLNAWLRETFSGF